MTWRPLRVRGGRLTLPGAVFTPDGLVVRGATYRWEQVGGHVVPDFAPMEPNGGWTVDVQIVPVANWAFVSALVVRVYQGDPPRPDVPESHTVVLGYGTYVVIAHRVLVPAALASFLRDEPRARAGLADPARVTALLVALRRTTRWRTGLPREPMMGDRYDLHWAVVRAFRAAFPRRYLDRRVDVDPVPPLGELVATARSELPRRLRDRFSDDEIAERMRPFVDRPPWPFGTLL